MKYKELVKHYTQLIKDENKNKWEVIETSDLADILEAYHKDKLKLLGIGVVRKRYYWLKPNGTISNMWNEEEHKKYISEKDIKDAEKNGWQLIQINVF